MDSSSFNLSYSPVPRSMYLGKERSFAPSHVADIVIAVENNPDHCQIISLISSYEGEGCAEIAFEMAAALSSSGKRVLIVDAESNDTGVYREFRYRIPASMSSLLQDISSHTYTVLHLEKTNVFYCCFCKSGEEKKTVYHSERLASFFVSLRGAFDYVLLVSEPTAALSIASAAQISDASIVIVEAERTRRPVVAQLIENIKLNGGKILGLVLNKRPLYIPPALYRCLYK